MLYLTCIASFCMQAQSVYSWAWSLYLQVRCVGLIILKPGKWKVNIEYYNFFNCRLYLTCIESFYMGTRSVYSNVWSLYTCGNVFYTCRFNVFTYLQERSVMQQIWLVTRYEQEILVGNFFYTKKWISYLQE